MSKYHLRIPCDRLTHPVLVRAASEASVTKAITQAPTVSSKQNFRKPGNLETWKPGNPEIWKLGMRLLSTLIFQLAHQEVLFPRAK